MFSVMSFSRIFIFHLLLPVEIMQCYQSWQHGSKHYVIAGRAGEIYDPVACLVSVEDLCQSIVRRPHKNNALLLLAAFSVETTMLPVMINSLTLASSFFSAHMFYLSVYKYIYIYI